MPAGRGQRHVVRVREVLVALSDPGRAPEVVDRDGRDALLAEPEGELLVEVVQAADVGKDDDAAAGRRVGAGRERREPRPVGGLEHEVVVRDRRARDRRDRRAGVGVVTHGARR